MKSSQQDKYNILSRESEADIIRNDGITLCEGTVRSNLLKNCFLLSSHIRAAQDVSTAGK